MRSPCCHTLRNVSLSMTHHRKASNYCFPELLVSSLLPVIPAHKLGTFLLKSFSGFCNNKFSRARLARNDLRYLKFKYTKQTYPSSQGSNRTNKICWQKIKVPFPTHIESKTTKHCKYHLLLLLLLTALHTQLKISIAAEEIITSLHYWQGIVADCIV
jgi:hypothetical protein